MYCSHCNAPHSQAIDVKKEEVRLERAEAGVTADTLVRCIPDTSPRYHFFLFKHTYEGHHEESVGTSEVPGWER